MTDDYQRNKADLQKTGMEFIEIELELVRTFCKASKETDDAERRERNMQNAERAYQAAVKTFKDFKEPGDD